MCQFCGDLGHSTDICPLKIRCDICGGEHNSVDCPDTNECSICHEIGHLTVNCPN